MVDVPGTTRQIRSLVGETGEVRVSIETVETPQPRSHQVLVRVEAAPLNPSDLGLLLAMTDIYNAMAGGSPDEPTITAPIPEPVMPTLTARVGKALPVGNEGAGVVVAAGSSPEAQALLGRTVGFAGEATYGEYCLAAPRMCLPLPEGAVPLRSIVVREPAHRAGDGRDHAHRGARRAGAHSGRVQPRADAQQDLPGRQRAPGQHRPASRAGPAAAGAGRRARVRLQRADVRGRSGRGAPGRPGRPWRSTRSAVGGLAGQVLNAMEAAIVPPDAPYNRYGSDVHKQVYVYGALDPRPIELRRRFGFAWGVGGWLLMPFLSRDQRGGPGPAAAAGRRRAHHDVRQSLLRPDLVARGLGAGDAAAATRARPPGRSSCCDRSAEPWGAARTPALRLHRNCHAREGDGSAGCRRASDALARRRSHLKPGFGDRPSTLFTDPVGAALQPLDCRLDLCQVTLDLQHERCNLGPLECNRRTLGIVLVVGVTVTGGRHHVIKVASHSQRGAVVPVVVPPQAAREPGPSVDADTTCRSEGDWPSENLFAQAGILGK